MKGHRRHCSVPPPALLRPAVFSRWSLALLRCRRNRSLLRHAAALYQGLGRDPATAPWGIEYGLLAAQGTASCRSAIGVSWRMESAAACGQRVSSPRKHPAQRPDSLCSPRTMPTSLLSQRPARETYDTTFAKPVATSLETLSKRRWPDCPPQVASRPCRPSPPAQVHLHHVCENPTRRSARGEALRSNSVRSTSKHSQR